MNDQPLTIAVLAGTTRAQRQSIHAARFIADFGRQLPGITILFADPAGFNFAGDGNDPEGKDARYTSIVEQADAFFIVSPEYNHSFPGSLKRMLDSELQLYIHKPVAFAGVSSGPWGGIRAVEALVSVVREMGLVATFDDVYFPQVQNTFDERGQLQTEHQTEYEKRLQTAYDELIWMARALKAARS